VYAVLANQRAEHAGEVWSALAPIQTGPAENPPRMLGPPLQDSADVHPDCCKTRNAGVRHNSGVAGQFDIAVPHESVSDGYAELTGQMVVAGSRSTQLSFGPIESFLPAGSSSDATCMMLSTMLATDGVARRW
jgi:hypothetical protein